MSSPKNATQALHFIREKFEDGYGHWSIESVPRGTSGAILRLWKDVFGIALEKSQREFHEKRGNPTAFATAIPVANFLGDVDQVIILASGRVRGARTDSKWVDRKWNDHPVQIYPFEMVRPNRSNRSYVWRLQPSAQPKLDKWIDFVVRSESLDELEARTARLGALLPSTDWIRDQALLILKARWTEHHKKSWPFDANPREKDIRAMQRAVRTRQEAAISRGEEIEAGLFRPELDPTDDCG